MATNEEIEQRLRMMAEAIPSIERQRRANSVDRVATELELLNMSAMTIWWLLGEIAKRLPEPKG